jgi:hypothetical protein
MTDYPVKLSEFPAFLHRIVLAWYEWEQVYLRKMGRYPRAGIREPLGGAAGDETVRGRRPPEMTNDNELAFIDDGDMSYYLVFADDVFYIDSKERGSRNTYWMFRAFEDAEKYVLFLISQMARPGDYTDSPAFRWYQEGLDPRVTLSRPDPVNFPGRVSLRVDQEATDRGWMAESDAPAASHVLLLSYNQLDSALREGIPPEWFTINFVVE